ncbi:unnamed protein product [Ceratitis capitata]|uniref:(Mediterranean fruit fly) hypothetical protein n=1 Tax=Ceratitis capitata TaxID=7213 RepID=A0A811UEH8_CERCA|nr:unnamed protein product [Ceratitis capitata]
MEVICLLHTSVTHTHLTVIARFYRTPIDTQKTARQQRHKHTYTHACKPAAENQKSLCDTKKSLFKKFHFTDWFSGQMLANLPLCIGISSKISSVDLTFLAATSLFGPLTTTFITALTSPSGQLTNGNIGQLDNT